MRRAALTNVDETVARFGRLEQLFRNLNDPAEYDAALGADGPARTDNP